MVHLAAVVVFPLCMAYGAVSDLCRFDIPNWISVALSASFLAAALAQGWEVSAMLSHLGAGALMLLIGFILFALKLFGGGDAKIMAAAALWFGWGGLAPFLLITTLGGGVLAVALVVFRRLPLPGFLASKACIRQLHSENPGVPYGVAIAVAAFIVFPRSPLVAAGLMG
jgi:prepilin peptidase CpaA